MSHTYTPDPARNPSSTILPDPGNLADANQADDAWKDCINKAAHANWPEQDASKTYPLKSRGAVRTQRSFPVSTVDASNVPGWAVKVANVASGHFTQNYLDGMAHGGVPVIYQPLELPQGALLTQVEVWIQGANGHGALPDLPTLDIWKWDVTVGTHSSICGGPVTDPSASTGAYENSHTIVANGMTEVVDNVTNRYIAVLVGEGDNGNGATGLAFYGAISFCTVTAQDPGAA